MGESRNETFTEDDDVVLGLNETGEEEVIDDGMSVLEPPAEPPAPKQTVVKPKKTPPKRPSPAQQIAGRRAAPPKPRPAPKQTVQQPAQQNAIQPAQTQQLAEAPEHVFEVLQAGDLGQTLKAFKDNFGPRGLSANDLETITVPQGGQEQWMLETLEGKKVYYEELAVIVINWNERRALWPDEEEQSRRPLCTSDDAEHGRGDPGGICDECPYSEWASDSRGNGQACKMTRVLYSLLSHDPDQKLPTRIQIPPSSIPVNRRFFTRLATRGISFYNVVIGLTIKAEDGPRGPYGVVHAKVIRRATEDEVAAVEAYREAIGAQLNRIKVTRQDMANVDQ